MVETTSQCRQRRIVHADDDSVDLKRGRARERADAVGEYPPSGRRHATSAATVRQPTVWPSNLRPYAVLRVAPSLLCSSTG